MIGAAVVSVRRGMRRAHRADWRQELSGDEWAEIERFVEGSLLARLARAWDRLEQALLEGLRLLVAELTTQGALPPAIAREIRKWARRFGLDGWARGDLARTHGEALWRSLFGEKVREAQRIPEVVAAHPYWRFLAQDVAVSQGGTTRDNHAALHNFVARADWPGWSQVLPPLGWNCRCRIVRISSEDARARGWSSTFPEGTEGLQAHQALGGFDAGFPRELFVLT